MESTIAAEKTVRQTKMGRRALIATGTLAALGVGIIEAPLAVNLGRRLLAEEIANLEGIALDTASTSVDAAYQAVNLIVEPIAGALSSISAESLDGLIVAVSAAMNIPGIDTNTRLALANLRNILQAWKTNVALFPATVAALDAVPRDAGKRYLASLKAKQKAEAQEV